MIDNADTNLKTVEIILSSRDYNFPADNETAIRLIGGESGLLKHIVENSSK